VKVIGGFSGFSEEELLKGIIVFANNTPDVKDVFKDKSNVFMPTQYDYNSADDFKNIKSLPLLMSIYSVIIKPEFISESTSVNSVIEPEPAKPNDGIHLTLAIKGGAASPSSALGGGNGRYLKLMQRFVEQKSLPARFNPIRKSKLYDEESTFENANTTANESLAKVKDANNKINNEIKELAQKLIDSTKTKELAETYYKNAINKDELSKTIYEKKDFKNKNSTVYYASKQVKLIEKHVSDIEQKLQEINDYEKKLNDLQGIVTKSTEQFIPKVKLGIAIPGGSNGLIQTGGDITLYEEPTSVTIKALKQSIQDERDKIETIVIITFKNIQQKKVKYLVLI
jgi:hypothetical protein